MLLQRSAQVTVVVAGTDTHHDLYQAAGALRDIVAEAGLPVQLAVGLDRFADPMPVTTETDVFVVYASGVAMSLAEQQALRELVDRGVGLVAVHSSCVPLAGGQETFLELIGASYLGHCPDASEGRIAVRVGEHPITTRLSGFEVDDEYYRTTITPDSTVLAEHQLTDGSWAPALIVRQQGRGRVGYTSLGHDWRSWGNPWVRQLIRQTVVWAAGIDPSADAQVRSWTTRFPLGNARSIGGGLDRGAQQ